MKKILDLTKPLNSSLEIYADENYRDPDFSCTEWASIERQGYQVSALTLGTQTGTHIDAPAHFYALGKRLDDLSCYLEKRVTGIKKSMSYFFFRAVTSCALKTAGRRQTTDGIFFWLSTLANNKIAHHWY